MDCPRAYHTSARPVFRSILTALTPATRSTERCALCTQNGHDNPLMWITASAGPCILAVVAVGLFVVVAQPTANPAAARAATSVVPKRIIWLRSHSCRVSGGTSFRRVPRVAMPATETTGNATINGRCTRSIRTDPRSSEESTPPYAATQTGHEKLANSGSTAVRASARRAAGFSPRGVREVGESARAEALGSGGPPGAVRNAVVLFVAGRHLPLRQHDGLASVSVFFVALLPSGHRSLHTSFPVSGHTIRPGQSGRFRSIVGH